MLSEARKNRSARRSAAVMDSISGARGGSLWPGAEDATRSESAISALQRGWLRIVIPPETGESIRGRSARDGYDFAP